MRLTPNGDVQHSNYKNGLTMSSLRQKPQALGEASPLRQNKERLNYNALREKSPSTSPRHFQPVNSTVRVQQRIN